MSKPSKEAMRAARVFYDSFKGGTAITYVAAIARAMDAFAEAGVMAERESIRGWLETYVSDSVVRQFDEDNKRLDAKRGDRAK